MTDIFQASRVTSGGAASSPYMLIRRNYVVRADEVLSPREIVARLHEEIAAKSPEHARLVAAFRRRQAARETP
jgi:hypothetical protein